MVTKVLSRCAVIAAIAFMIVGKEPTIFGMNAVFLKDVSITMALASISFSLATKK